MGNRITTTWVSVPPSVTIVAVTKTFPFETVAMARAMGLTHFGENRIEEAREKILEAKKRGLPGIIWHMIGHVQSRRVRDVVDLFDRVDSVDSIGLLTKLDGAAASAGKKLHVLLEMNVSGEESKYGFSEIPNTLPYHNLVIDGLMTMAPLVTNPEDNRRIFRKLNEAARTVRAQNPMFGRELSMGTSRDYQVAIEEGATEIRLGEALFGPRQ